MKESIIQTTVNKFLTWLSKKSVTALYKQTHFWIFSWVLDEHTDLYIFSEESYHDRHRFGLHEETYDHKGEPQTEMWDEAQNDCDLWQKDRTCIGCYRYDICRDAACNDEPKTNKVVEKKPTPIRDFMVNGKIKDEL